VIRETPPHLCGRKQVKRWPKFWSGLDLDGHPPAALAIGRKAKKLFILAGHDRRWWALCLRYSPL